MKVAWNVGPRPEEVDDISELQFPLQRLLLMVGALASWVCG